MCMCMCMFIPNACPPQDVFLWLCYVYACVCSYLIHVPLRTCSCTTSCCAIPGGQWYLSTPSSACSDCAACWTCCSSIPSLSTPTCSRDRGWRTWTGISWRHSKLGHNHIGCQTHNACCIKQYVCIRPIVCYKLSPSLPYIVHVMCMWFMSCDVHVMCVGKKSSRVGCHTFDYVHMCVYVSTLYLVCGGIVYVCKYNVCYMWLCTYRFNADARGLLVASDVAARGLDFPNVEHVIHYQVPMNTEVLTKALGVVVCTCKHSHSCRVFKFWSYTMLH